MDTHTIIIVLIITVFCSAIFLLSSRSKKKNESQFLEALFGLAGKNKCKISKYERWNNSIIGIDETSSSIFAVRKLNDTEITEQIDLADIQKCRVNETSRIVNIASRTAVIDGSNTKAVDKIELEFYRWDKNKPGTLVEFYNVNYDSLNLGKELQIAEKWCKTVNDRIDLLAQKK